MLYYDWAFSCLNFLGVLVSGLLVFDLLISTIQASYIKVADPYAF